MDIRMNVTFKLLICFSSLALYACASTHEVNEIPEYTYRNLAIGEILDTVEVPEYKPDPIQVIGEILEFKEKAFSPSRSDGAYEPSDVISFKILEPKKYKGEKIIIFISAFSKTRNELRESGNVFNFKIDQKIFKPDSHALYFIGQDRFQRITNEKNP